MTRSGPFMAVAALLPIVSGAARAERFDLAAEYRPSPLLVEGLYVCRNERSVSHSLLLSAGGTYMLADMAAGGGGFRLGADGALEWLSGPLAASEGDAVRILAMNARGRARGEPVVILLYDMPGVQSRDHCFLEEPAGAG